MADRRSSSRSRKAVKYSGFVDISDDDFADTTPPPPTKKPKTLSKLKEKDVATESQHKSSSNLQHPKEAQTKGRRSVSEKLFDRDLEEALQLSLRETGDSQESQEPPLLSPSLSTNEDVQCDDPPPLSPIKCDSLSNRGDAPPSLPLTSTAIGSTEPNTSKGPVASTPAVVSVPRLTTVMDDSIEILDDTPKENKEETSSRGQRRTRSVRQIKKKPVVIDSDSDDESDFDPNKSDDEEDSPQSASDDSDCDFDKTLEKSKKKGNSKAVKGKAGQQQKQQNKLNLSKMTVEKSAANVRSATTTRNLTSPATIRNLTNPATTSKLSSLAATNKMTSPAATNKMTSPTSRASTSGKKSVTPSPVVSTTVPHRTTPVLNSSLKTQWKPPERVSPGSSSLSAVKSPSSGGLRLGLSRNQRVKPLHPSVSVK